MAKIEMDCNLKKIGQFFNVIPVYFGEIEIAQNLIIACSSQQKSLDIFYRYSKSNLMLAKRYPSCQIFEQFDQNTLEISVTVHLKEGNSETYPFRCGNKRP